MSKTPEKPDTPESDEDSRIPTVPAMDLPTPDRLLHTGSENPIDPEDLVRLTGREPTPARIEAARRLLEEEGPAAIERYLP